MKRILALFLCVLAVFSLCACGGGSGEKVDASGLKVGFSKVNLTPGYVTGLGGYSDAETRTSEGFLDYIYVTCLAIGSGEETILLYTIDTCGLGRNDKDAIRSVVSGATQIPKDKVFIGATHGHNCPALTGYATANQFAGDMQKYCAQAGTEALADMAPATFYRAKADHQGMNFVRHYVLDDGTFLANSDARGLEDRLVGHPMETDPEMILLKFDREGDKKDILTVHWQAHPDAASSIGYNMISPGFIGPLRNKLEKDTGMLVAYFTGASGNQNTDSRIASEANNLEWDDYGEKLAELAEGMFDSFQKVEGTEIKTTNRIVYANVDHSWDHMIDAANEIYDLWKSTDKATGDEAGKKYGFSSVYQARAIRSRFNMGNIISMDVRAFSIGDVGFTTGTYEMFSTNAMFVKENSPFETTVIITGNSSYVPAQVGYTYRNYEVDTGFYAEGTGELLADNYVEMLKSLKSE